MVLNVTRQDHALLKRAFPRIRGKPYQFDSPPTFDYNCHAFAMGQQNRRWVPIESSSVYWPQGVPLEFTLAAFRAAYETEGFERCDSPSYEPGFVKIALYARDKEIRHTALQIDPINWKSKLGPWFDIVHKLKALEGKEYGRVVAFMRKPVAAQSPPAPDPANTPAERSSP